jgi:tetratricopeptide (TPR) repeat protein
MKNLNKIFLQAFVIVVIYYVLVYFNLFSWYLVLAVVFIIFIYTYFKIRITDNELFFETVCDVHLYLRRAQNSKSYKKEKDYELLVLAYSLIYQGDFDKADAALSKINPSGFPNPKRHYSIYIRLKSRLASIHKDVDQLDSLQKEVDDEQLQEYIKVMTYLAKEQYDELIVYLKGIMPKQILRMFIIEYEYYLAISYLKTEKIEDALALFEYITKKGFGIVFTKWAYEEYIKIKDNQ